MTIATKILVAGAAMAAFTAVPALAVPGAAPDGSGAVIAVSGWATRAEGRRHTYPEGYGYGVPPYGYGYGYGRGPYGGWGEGGIPEPYGAYGRAGPPAYGYGDPYGY